MALPCPSASPVAATARSNILQIGAFALLQFVVLTQAGHAMDMGTEYSYIGCFQMRVDILSNSKYAGNVQTCIGICERMDFRYALLMGEKCFCANTYDESERYDLSMCYTRCTKNYAQYCGGLDSVSYYSTDVQKPLRDLSITNRTEHSLLLTWGKFRISNEITSVSIKAYVTHSFANYPLYSQPEYSVQGTEDHFEMTDLHPGTQYNITVNAMCDNNVCDSDQVIGETIIGIPDPAPKELLIREQGNGTITVQLEPAMNNNGPITSYLLIVEKIDDAITQSFDEEVLGDYFRSIEDGTPYYIAAEIPFSNQTKTFIIGDGKRYDRFYNAPLPSDAHIHVSLGVVSTHNGSKKIRYAIANHSQHDPQGFVFADFESGEESILALSITCVILFIFLIFSVFTYFYLRYKTSNRRQRLTDTHELTVQGPMTEVENDGFVNDNRFKSGDYRAELNAIVENVDSTQKFSRNAIRLNIDKVLAKGSFGEVISGKLYTNTEAFDCQVHVVSEDMEPQDQTAFLTDLDELIRSMPHDKFMQFYGVSASPDWFYVIFEDYSTSLKRKLVESRLPLSEGNERFSTLSEECVLQWVFEVAVALEYLEVNKIVHKKLSTHNVYLTPTNEIKISLFGASPLGDQGKPIDIARWWAPEVLRFQHHSLKSTVWSFACLAWECCTLGATPYANITTQDLMPRIRNGVRPEQTTFVFNDLYQLFLNCWQLEPSERTDFEDIAFNVRQILTSPRHALSFDRTENTVLPYYLPLLEVQQN